MAHPDTVILSHHGNRIKTVYPLEHLGFSEGFMLQHYTTHGMGEIGVNREELLALLRVLPSDLLTQVLSERGEVVTLDLDDPACTSTDDEPVPYKITPNVEVPVVAQCQACGYAIMADDGAECPDCGRRWQSSGEDMRLERLNLARLNGTL